MVDPALKRSFAEEVVLLQSAGLQPVIVHGGGPEITKTLEKLGRKSGVRRRPARHRRRRGAGRRDGADRPDQHRDRRPASTAGAATPSACRARTGACSSRTSCSRRPGKPDLGFVGEIEAVNADLLDMFLERGYMPVISPVGLRRGRRQLQHQRRRRGGRDRGRARRRAADLPDRRRRHPRRRRELISEIRAADLEARLRRRASRAACTSRCRRCCTRSASGVRAVHVVDGRQPHSVVAELFTDRGVGTLVT